MNKKQSTVNGQRSTVKRWSMIYGLLSMVFLLSSCGVYTFRDVSVDYSKIKTIKVGFIDNKAHYINPQLSPKLTDNLKQKINSYTKLTMVNSDDANYIITGYINRYDVSLSAISNNQSAGNRLTVGASITFTNTVDNKTDNFTVSRDFDFSASLSLQQAEAGLQADIINQLTDQIFNHIFSNW
ncbi:MAG: LPS assembly lipoprotein LptE [Parafilimonas sp.]